MHNIKFQNSKSTQMVNSKVQNQQKDQILAQESDYNQTEATTHRICPHTGQQPGSTYLSTIFPPVFICHQLLIIRNPSDALCKYYVI